MSQNIRIRVCLAVVKAEKLLLLPHYNTDVGPVQWVIPGGRLEFGERLEAAAQREFLEETGLQAEVIALLDVSEVVKPEQPWHSVTITFIGSVTGGEIRAEPDNPYGSKTPRWFSAKALAGLHYHPAKAVEKAFEFAYSQNQDYTSRKLWRSAIG